MSDMTTEPMTAQPRPATLTIPEMVKAVAFPNRLVELVLGNSDRLMSNVTEERHLALLAALLFGASLLFAIPFGAAPPVAAFWKVAALYAGSLTICFPSFYVFGRYLGLGLSLAQSLVVALLVSTVSAIVSFGFFPIVWFIAATTRAGASLDASQLAAFLLGTGLLLGVVHLGRCLRGSAALRRHPVMLAGWVCLLAFITWRMAGVLGLVG